MKKLTTEEIKEQFQNIKINSNVEIIASHYINCKIDVKCKKCGYVWDMSLGNLRKGKGCPNCYGNRVKSLEEITKQLHSKFPKIDIIDGYTRMTHKARFYCHDCKNEFNSIVHHILNRGCPFCNLKNSQEINKHNLKYVDNPKITNEEFVVRLSKENPTIKPLEKMTGYMAEKIKCQCLKCGHIWKISPTNLLTAHKGCPECGKHKGEEHWNYRHDLTEEQRIDRRLLFGYKTEFIIACMERDNYTCQITDRKGGDLQVHHLNGYNWDIKNRMNPNNGITLSKEIHKRFHDIYGMGYNTKEQFIEFITMLYQQNEISNDKYNELINILKKRI